MTCRKTFDLTQPGVLDSGITQPNQQKFTAATSQWFLTTKFSKSVTLVRHIIYAKFKTANLFFAVEPWYCVVIRVYYSSGGSRAHSCY